MAGTLLISTVIVHFSVCAAWSGGLITRSAVVGKVGGLKWTLWTLILRVRRTQIKCAALVQTENLKVRQQCSPGEEKLQFVIAFHTLPWFCEMWIIFLTKMLDHTSPATWFDKIFVCRSSLSSRSSRRWWIYFKSLGFSLKLPSWSEIITVITVAIQRNWIFVIRLWWIMYVPLSWLLSITALHGSFISLFIPLTVNRGFSRDFGKKAPSAMPSTPGGGSKIVPIASLNPYQSKWVCSLVTGKLNVMSKWCIFGRVKTHCCINVGEKRILQQYIALHQQDRVKCCMLRLDVEDNINKHVNNFMQYYPKALTLNQLCILTSFS